MTVEHIRRCALSCVAAGLLAALPALAWAKDDSGGSFKTSGVLQFEAARTVADPEHTSKLKSALDLNFQGAFSEDVKWKLGGRVWYDAAYDDSNFYPPAVEHDQRTEARALENYLDISKGNWDFRLGRQQIVWGEVVGLFFADVVSAKDLRETVAQDFDRLRIPQWATRAEWFKGDFHAEAIWIPYMTYDDIGKPGADFYPFPPAVPGLGLQIRDEEIPTRSPKNSAYGARFSYLKNGWDGSLFYYNSPDASASFRREFSFTSPTPRVFIADSVIYTPQHTRISQAGFTLAKDFGEVVLKAELVYTKDREFTVTRLTDDDGLVKQNTLDYIIGADWPYSESSRLNVQLFGRSVANHDPDTLQKKQETGITLLWATKFGKWEPQVLLISSLSRSDWMARPRITWNFTRNWRAAFGADFFGGEPTGLFGRFDKSDRVYTELRYTF